jgi:hypothetical protein
MRYLSLLYRQPFVFSSIVEGHYSGACTQVKDIFQGFKNKSFESWVDPSSGKSLPEQFAYRQDGKGGSIKRYTEHDGLKDGMSSVLLKPSSCGSSYLRYETSDLDEARGTYIRVSVWVKSQNKSVDAIQVYIQTDGNAPLPKSYHNTGDWENLVLVKYIDRNTATLKVTCDIKSHATEPVYLDGILIEILDINTDTFEYALKSKRWNSFLLLKKYFELIHMDISPSSLEEMFAVGKPSFQFKQGVVSVPQQEIPTFLKYLGERKSVELLQKFLIVDEKWSSHLGISAEEYKKALSRAQEDGNGFKRRENFTYTISHYTYNALKLRVSTDEGFLYWADGYDKDWHAYIHGQEIPIYRANINFKAVRLPKGTSAITFIYNPFFKVGLYFFYGVFVFVAVIVFLLLISGCIMPKKPLQFKSGI